MFSVVVIVNNINPILDCKTNNTGLNIRWSAQNLTMYSPSYHHMAEQNHLITELSALLLFHFMIALKFICYKLHHEQNLILY